MVFLSWLFFCLSPFALFCSEDGNGLILCPIFIVLGLVFKWLNERNNRTFGAVVKVHPSEFWEKLYMDYIYEGNSDIEAKKRATSLARLNGCRVPSSEEQEDISKKHGVMTQEAKKIESEPIDRVQFGKCYLLRKIGYDYRQEGHNKIKDHDKAIKYIKIGEELEKHSHYVEYANNFSVRTYVLFGTGRFGHLGEDKIWNELLTEQERHEARMWTRECIKRILETERCCVPVNTLLDRKYREKYGYSVGRDDLR